jgi:predicted amidohydrolase YtcJ
MKSALRLGMHPANHTDFNVAPINQIDTVDSAVNRRTRSGVVLGESERVTPLEALRAITLDGARLYGEEATKGSIEVGKFADFVILSADPTAVPPDQIGKVEVVETIKEGTTVWRKR